MRGIALDDFSCLSREREDLWGLSSEHGFLPSVSGRTCPWLQAPQETLSLNVVSISAQEPSPRPTLLPNGRGSAEGQLTSCEQGDKGLAGPRAVNGTVSRCFAQRRRVGS